eukprot:Gb_01857 [translate_table: standard]
MADNLTHGTVVEDIFGVLKVYNDGSIVCPDEPNFTILPLQQPSDENDTVLSKDVVLDANRSGCVSIFLPNPPLLCPLLAPEHCLPATYNNSVAVLEWLCKQSMEQSTIFTVHHCANKDKN